MLRVGCEPLVRNVAFAASGVLGLKVAPSSMLQGGMGANPANRRVRSAPFVASAISDAGILWFNQLLAWFYLAANARLRAGEPPILPVPKGSEGRRGGYAARQAFIPHPGSGPPSPRIGPSGCTIGTPMGDLSRGVLRGKRPRVRREGVYAGGSQGVLTHSPTRGINPR